MAIKEIINMYKEKLFCNSYPKEYIESRRKIIKDCLAFSIGISFYGLLSSNDANARDEIIKDRQVVMGSNPNKTYSMDEIFMMNYTGTRKKHPYLISHPDSLDTLANLYGLEALTIMHNTKEFDKPVYRGMIKYWSNDSKLSPERVVEALYTIDKYKLKNQPRRVHLVRASKILKLKINQMRFRYLSNDNVKDLLSVYQNALKHVSYKLEKEREVTKPPQPYVRPKNVATIC